MNNLLKKGKKQTFKNNDKIKKTNENNREGISYLEIVNERNKDKHKLNNFLKKQFISRNCSFGKFNTNTIKMEKMCNFKLNDGINNSFNNHSSLKKSNSQNLNFYPKEKSLTNDSKDFKTIYVNLNTVGNQTKDSIENEDEAKLKNKLFLDNLITEKELTHPFFKKQISLNETKKNIFFKSRNSRKTHDNNDNYMTQGNLYIKTNLPINRKFSISKSFKNIYPISNYKSSYENNIQNIIVNEYQMNILNKGLHITKNNNFTINPTNNTNNLNLNLIESNKLIERHNSINSIFEVVKTGLKEKNEIGSINRKMFDSVNSEKLDKIEIKAKNCKLQIKNVKNSLENDKNYIKSGCKNSVYDKSIPNYCNNNFNLLETLPTQSSTINGKNNKSHLNAKINELSLRFEQKFLKKEIFSPSHKITKNKLISNEFENDFFHKKKKESTSRILEPKNINLEEVDKIKKKILLDINRKFEYRTSNQSNNFTFPANQINLNSRKII